MPTVSWRLSQACAALLAVLISALGGFRAAVDHAPGARFAAVAVVRDLGLTTDRYQAPQIAWRAPVAGQNTDDSTAPLTQTWHPSAPALLQGSAGGPRAP